MKAYVAGKWPKKYSLSPNEPDASEGDNHGGDEDIATFTIPGYGEFVRNDYPRVSFPGLAVDRTNEIKKGSIIKSDILPSYLANIICGFIGPNFVVLLQPKS